MIYKSNAPAPAKQNTRARHHYKSNQNSLPPAQRKVYTLLSDGGMYSAADISTALRLCDPRGTIRDLRKQGIGVSDVWCMGEYRTRFKRYFIRKGGIV